MMYMVLWAEYLVSVEVIGILRPERSQIVLELNKIVPLPSFPAPEEVGLRVHPGMPPLTAVFH